MSPGTANLDSGSGISTMPESVAAKLQAAVPDVQTVGVMSDDQYVNMANSKLVLVKHKSCPVRIALHTMWGPVVIDRVSYTVLPVKEVKVIAIKVSKAEIFPENSGELGHFGLSVGLSLTEWE